MESIIEVQRHLHEERERLVDAVSKEFLSDKKSHKEKVNSDHRVKDLLRRFDACTDRLLIIYDDADGERQREMRAISGPNEFADFYSRLKALKDAHRRNPGDTTTPLNIEFQEMIDSIQNPSKDDMEVVKFSDEEGYGRFLDMNALYLKYLNLKGIQRLDYMSYIGKFDHVDEISKDSTKKTGAYREYLIELEQYLMDFLRRVKPLFNSKKELARVDAEFEENWKKGLCRGWSKEKPHTAMANAGAFLNLSEFNSAEELESLGLDRLKTALIALNMKCGGSLKERAARLYATKGKSTEELQEETKNDKRSVQQAKEELRLKGLANIEAHVMRLADLLHQEREATKENCQRKQARAVGETDDLDEDADIIESDEDNEAEEDVPYNPKNLPLGWDGKPIPYWLYKLHGLNISYSCEICGNQTYKGPKAFQKHFTEWRHSHGMRCLGIPNTAHFANITKIEEAVGLWRKLQSTKKSPSGIRRLTKSTKTLLETSSTVEPMKISNDRAYCNVGCTHDLILCCWILFMATYAQVFNECDSFRV
ncbi:hypothetical protein L596_006519 [Steinernema carpocapsae]|uniref:Matrin-type domain-containing protein n=1 Tax=Steinernema carpocapsae TaxID=34508 RepID=A0A4U8V2B0_STECR|nr:hypothetical protein L596_006519 [Steinernema carpocapsae]